MPISILAYGWYHHGNVGDELFCDAFRLLMPEAELTFVDKISAKDLEGKRAVVFGGGSFLYKEPRIDSDVFDLLVAIPTAYIGVGVEAEVHPVHLRLMKKSKIVAVRTALGTKHLRSMGVDAMSIPDIVHIVPVVQGKRIPNSILFVSNVETIPKWDAPSWAHLAWERFKNEAAQFLDERLSSGWKISFLSMCKNLWMDDLWAATEIVSKMTRRSTRFEMIQASEISASQVLEEFSKRSIVISQRYHGLVLAEMVNVPSISVHHHDKLKNIEPFRGEKVPYYEFSKRPLHAAVDELHGKLMNSSVADFSELKSKIAVFLKGVHDGQVCRHTK